ncbi:MAG: GFA family protein [Hellea sp.]|nr:GFA family protein [Hellea sp.]
MARHKASCHCGAVSLDFEAPAHMSVTICNCSICKKTGHQHIFVPQSGAIISGKENLSLYTFGTGAAKHYFCKICGTKPFYIPKSHPEDYSVNLRCVVGDTITASETIEFDGQNWEKNIDSLRSKT